MSIAEFRNIAEGADFEGEEHFLRMNPLVPGPPAVASATALTTHREGFNTSPGPH